MLTKLKEFLDSHKIHYTNIKHSPAFTAPEIAQAAHIAGKEMAKTVIVKIDGEMKMIVLPSNIKIDFDAIRSTTHSNKV
jgi:Ala-tRNA(Pro) deacylase